MVDIRSFVYKDKKRDIAQFKGPIVVWNLTSRCNLDCIHCYAAKEKKSIREIPKKVCLKTIKELKVLKTPLVIFSGGEPLLYKDIFNLSRFAIKNSIKVSLSSNGTLIDAKMASLIKKSGIGYVGISIDGMKATHDFLRNKKGAFEKSIKAIENCKKDRVKVGIRFTIARYNIRDLKAVLNLTQSLQVDRFCLYNLVYSGRGAKLVDNDLSIWQRRKVVDELVEFVEKTNGEIEVLTTDSPCDGVYLMNKFNLKNLDLSGCSAGEKIINIDEAGFIHPCQFWHDYNIGNIRNDKISSVLKKDALVLKLKDKGRFLKDKCGQCIYKQLCFGCRVRAKAIYDDLWGKDPSCYLSDKEVRNEISKVSSAQTAQ
ncbi:MAG: radical SAM protein [Candidatus Gygaella obscura]|nr:radical SAM protein [Candidatus Gygaella obscura]